MSFQAMAWAVKQQLPTNEKFLLIMLANYASNDDGECFPAIETLMRETALARTTVRKCLHSLQTKGYITAHERWSNGRQLSNSYRMAMGWWEGSPHDHRGSPHDRGGSPHGPTGGRHTTPNLSEEPINQPKKASTLKIDDLELAVEFEKFWDAYPKRPNNPKQPAIKSYMKARKEGASAEIILAGAMAYAKTRINKEPDYTAMAATWLNQKRWDDEYAPVKATRHSGNFV